MVTIVILIHVGTATNSHFESAANSTTVDEAAVLCDHILFQTELVDGSFD